MYAANSGMIETAGSVQAASPLTTPSAGPTPSAAVMSMQPLATPEGAATQKMGSPAIGTAEPRAVLATAASGASSATTFQMRTDSQLKSVGSAQSDATAIVVPQAFSPAVSKAGEREIEQSGLVNVKWRNEDDGKLWSLGDRISVRHIHSGPGVFLFDHNIKFMNNHVLPYLDQDRETCVAAYGEDWLAEFNVTLTLAEGAPARVAAVTQSLYLFRPHFIHILRPKSYQDYGYLRTDNVQWIRSDRASLLPPMNVIKNKPQYTGHKKIDERVNLLIEEMVRHRKTVE